MPRFASLFWVCCGLIAPEVTANESIKVSYVAGTLDIPAKTSGHLEYQDGRECVINWSGGKGQTRFSYDKVAFVETGSLHIKGTYEPLSMANKWLEFLTLVYTDDWGRAHILELRLKSRAESFLTLLSSLTHKDTDHRPSEATALTPVLRSSLVGSARRVTLRSTTWLGMPERSSGTIRAPDGEKLVLESGRKKLEIGYGTITSVEYGEKVSARFWKAVLLSVLLMNEGPFFLMRKQHRHFLTIDFNDEQGSPQSLVIEVPKYTARVLILELEIRSGKKVKFQSKEVAQDVYG